MSAITKSARGEPCALRIYGVCCDNGSHSHETTVFAHLSEGFSGVGAKAPDWWGIYACASCHDWLDRRTRSDDVPRDSAEGLRCILRALHWTQSKLISKELLKT